MASKIICFVRTIQAKRFHDIFETLDEANSENVRKVSYYRNAFIPGFY
jgi:hypothetical protein